MDLIKEFKESLKGLKPATTRAYVAGAKAAISAAMAKDRECNSHADLLALIRQTQLEKRARIAPFLRLLGGGEGGVNKSVPVEDVRGIQYWVIQTLAKHMRTQKNPSIAAKRDMALIASLCVAPAKGNARDWPKSCLKISGTHVLLWDKRVEEPAFALALRYWHAWRERLERPDQRRLYRKATEWGHSKLLFPGPRGRPLSRAASHNALRRLLSGVGEGSRRLTPQKIRAAFLAGDCLGTGSGLRPDALPPL
jgi:hypothetical protein